MGKINEKRSGLVGDRDRAKISKLSRNLSAQGWSPSKVQSHVENWLGKKGKLHYHGTHHKYEGAPKGKVHAGTKIAASDRLRNLENDEGFENPNTYNVKNRRIIPVTLNVDKDTHPVGSRKTPVKDGSTSNFASGGDVAVHKRRGFRLRRVIPTEKHQIAVYKNKVEDPGSISYTTKDSLPVKTVPQLMKNKKVNESSSLSYDDVYKMAIERGSSKESADKIASAHIARTKKWEERIEKKSITPSPLDKYHPSNWRRVK